MRFALFLLCLFQAGCSDPEPTGDDVVNSFQELTADEQVRLEAARDKYTKLPSKEQKIGNPAEFKTSMEEIQKDFDKQRNRKEYDTFPLGVGFGDAIAGKGGMIWGTIVWERKREFVLKVPSFSILIFPIAMIQKRIDDGKNIDFQDLFEETMKTIEEMKRNPEYQR